MLSLEIKGALEGLALLTIDDQARYKEAVAAGAQQGWGYYFPYLLSRGERDGSAVLWSEDGGSVCLFLWRRRKGGERLELPCAPTPMDAGVLRRCLERCNAFNRDQSARVLRIDENDAAEAGSLAELSVEERKQQYLYAPADFEDLGGRRFRTLRRNVALVEALENLEVVPYAPDHEADCRALLRRWGKDHRAQHGTAGGVGSAGRALDLLARFGPPDLRGEVILIGGRVCAFALGGEIRPGLGCFFEAKCDVEVRGLSYFQRSRFLSSFEGVALVNDGSDVGRSGLRQLKQSLRPVAMHTEYRGFQRAPGKSAGETETPDV